MVKVKNLERAKKKFKEAVSRAGPFYEAGILDPREDLVKAVEERKEAMHESLKDAIENDLIFGGLKRRGFGFWQERARTKGAHRWKDETHKRDDDWKTGFDPYAGTLIALVLEKKGRKGDSANVVKRVGAVVDALVKKKRELRGVKS
jgi:hypothetical protein